MMRSFHRTVILLCGLVAAAGCTTTYSSLQQGADAELIVGEEALVTDAIYRAIRQEFPVETIQPAGAFEKGFVWSRQPLADRTNFRLAIKTGIGRDEAGRAITGYFYTIDTRGTQALVDVRYVEPLKRAIRENLLGSRLAIVQVAAVTAVNPTQEAVAAQARARNCFDGLAEDPALGAIADKVALSDAQNPSFAMLVDNAAPTEREKAAILAWGKQRDVCIGANAAAMTRQMTPETIQTVIAAASAAQQLLIVDLYEGRLTFAAFSKRRQDLAIITNDATATIQMELRKQTAEARARAGLLALQAQQAMLLAQQAAGRGQRFQELPELTERHHRQSLGPRPLMPCDPFGGETTCF